MELNHLIESQTVKEIVTLLIGWQVQILKYKRPIDNFSSKSLQVYLQPIIKWKTLKTPNEHCSTTTTKIEYKK